jgi:hypothetical protein
VRSPGISGHPPANDKLPVHIILLHHTRNFAVDPPVLRGLFSRPHLNTELLAALLFLILFVPLSIFVTGRPRSPNLSSSLPP